MIPTFHTTVSHTAPNTTARADDWRLKGRCATAIEDDLWFPELSDRDTTRTAVKVCRACPVLLLCQQAVADEERGYGLASRHGIRGGLTPKQRWQADTSKPSDRGGRRLAECGTPAAYDRHVRRGEPVDEPCRKAHNKRTAQTKAEARHRRNAATGCGTTAAYYRHLMAGEPIDPACRAASDAYEQQLTVPPPPPECGTRGGYERHRRLGETACDPCRQANADADRRLRNTGTTTERSVA